MRTTFQTLLGIMAILITTGCHIKAGDITLVQNGAARHVIIVPDEASKAESRSAEVLQQYLKRMSGATLNIIKESAYNKDRSAIYIGKTTRGNALTKTKINGEGFWIGSDASDIFIVGGSGKGVLYGVYTLLETYLGCKKYTSAPASAPASKTINIPQYLDNRQEPAFVYRESYYPASADAEYLDWHKLHRFEDLWGIWGHSFFKLVPPKTYFATHPEYYALVNGKRQATQLCLSNDNVLRILTESLRNAMAENPDALYWSVSPEDGGGFCTCDKCSRINAAEGGHQGSLISFVNRVAAKFPQQNITTLAYEQTVHPPKNIKPAANVFVMLSTIAVYRHEPISSGASAASFRNDLKGWAAKTPNIFIWDYTTQFTNYLNPFPDYLQIQPNLRYFADNGVKGIFSQGSGATFSDMAAYNSYLQAKLLWKQDLDFQAASKAFLNDYYGAAGPFIIEYLDALHKGLQSSKTRLDIYGGTNAGYLKPELLDQYSTLLDKAEQAVGGNVYLQERVYETRLSLEYVVLQQSRFYGAEKFGYLVPQGAAYVVNPKWPARVQRFVAQAKKAGVTELSEGGLSPDAYAKEWADIFAKKWLNSMAFGAKVNLQFPYSEDYPAKGERTLTDGLTGGLDFSTNWLYFYGQDMVATIDLGQAKNIQRVQTSFLQDARHYIFAPVSVMVETSVDGKTYKPAGRQDLAAVGEEDYTAAIRNVQLNVPATSVRYIRVTAKCLPAIPAWRGAENKKPGLCCDEITIL
ncbi:DUF4838 domain-containing protein [Chitinophaga horti]|uniref:DUF4838 domain-containing protein n=1 Tax=Chitinophaga horti TaxID=2920382 RepID=A0ABY6J568_9BACT|nr:DUF4838 domain-containing protein [Chitinophaga horti]UYQ94821.1 DUF4838 domain-containing protein [Chitinophaga horti]